MSPLRHILVLCGMLTSIGTFAQTKNLYQEFGADRIKKIQDVK